MLQLVEANSLVLYHNRGKKLNRSEREQKRALLNLPCHVTMSMLKMLPLRVDNQRLHCAREINFIKIVHSRN